jgi:protein-S-isoprenylcysteine O-methyltransferase Ste14
MQANPRAGGPGRKLPWLVLLSRWRVNLGFAIGVTAIVMCGHPTRESVIAWLPLALGGLMLRLWARGHLELRKGLAESGPFAILRHPLYVGSFVLGLAFTLMMNDAIVSVVYVIGFLAMYVPKAIREETYLRKRHGDVYARYAERVGAIVPRFWNAHRAAATTRFAWQRVFRHREYETWLGAAAACAVMWVRAVWFAR